MKALLLFFFMLVLLSACNRSPVTMTLAQSDSLVVQFFGEKEVLENAAQTTSKDAIKEIAGFVGADYQDSVYCKKGGRLIFYLSGKETHRVTWKPECRQFEFEFDGKKRFTGMTRQALYFITDIKNSEQ